MDVHWEMFSATILLSHLIILFMFSFQGWTFVVLLDNWRNRKHLIWEENKDDLDQGTLLWTVFVLSHNGLFANVQCQTISNKQRHTNKRGPIRSCCFGWTVQLCTMKRPKQQSQSLSFLSFFSRKPKSDPRIEKPTGTLNKEEVAITLTPNEHEEQVRRHLHLFCNPYICFSLLSVFCKQLL